MKEAKAIQKQIAEEEAAKPDWKLDKNDNIKVNSMYNIEQVLEKDPMLKGIFCFNDFTNEIDVTESCPDLRIEKGQLKDSYVDEIASYIENNADYGVLFKQPLLRSALIVIAHRHHYNPVIDYMNEAYDKWDHKQRIEKFFCEYLGTPENDVTALIATLFFVGAVAKCYEPTIKFDFVLDLVGGQGAGKTTILQKIAPLDYYTDQFTSFEDKDSFAVMRRALIVNDDEMTATANSSFETLKKFVTLQIFEYRKPYGHQAERFPKGFVLARTTNNLYYLKDKTGERRFLPLLVEKSRQKKNPVTDLTPEYVQQLWGEAVHLYRDGDYSFELTKEQSDMLDEHRKSFMYTDTLEDAIADALENEWQNRDFLTANTIALKVAAGADLAKNRKLSNQIANIMVNRFGWRKGQKKFNGKNTRGYIKR